MVGSSIGEDSRFSFLQEEFDSPTDYLDRSLTSIIKLGLQWLNLF